jgi:hypothetical protein
MEKVFEIYAKTTPEHPRKASIWRSIRRGASCRAFVRFGGTM